MSQPRQPPPAWTGGRAMVAVAAGGALGALARYATDRLLPRPDGLPLSTLTVNVVGCFLMGLLVAAILRRPDAHPVLRPFLAVGVLGGFTTFSAYAADIRAALVEGRVATALVYAVATLVLCVGAAWLGLLLGARRRPVLDEGLLDETLLDETPPDEDAR